jgi:hypothetical protein
MKKERLTARNYHSTEMNKRYWSASQLKAFLDCPARAMAELNGEWEPLKSDALLIGSYVDAAFESKKSFELFGNEHPEIFKRDGTLKSELVKAENMIQRAKRDSVFMDFMKGRHQVINTATLWGVPFKAKFDVLAKDRIVDLKTVKDFKPLYREGEGRLNVVDYWRWTLQMALYQRIEGHNLPCYIAAITKEDPPDLAIIQIPQARMDAEIDYISTRIELFKGIKDGVLEPERCEKCAYCRATRKLKGAVTLDYFDMVGGSND